MAAQDSSIVPWLICGLLIILLAVVFFVLPYQPLQGTASNSTGAPSGYVAFAIETQNLTAGNCTIVEFYGAECPHCKNMVPVVAQVENETGVNFMKLEVWHNTTNQDIFNHYADNVNRDCGMLGVPTFLSLGTNHSKCGEMSESDLKDFVTSSCSKA